MCDKVLIIRIFYTHSSWFLSFIWCPFLFQSLDWNCTEIEKTFKLNAPIFYKCHANATFQVCSVQCAGMAMVFYIYHPMNRLFSIFTFYFRYSNVISICCYSHFLSMCSIVNERIATIVSNLLVRE